MVRMEEILEKLFFTALLRYNWKNWMCLLCKTIWEAYTFWTEY